jgi:hypothetical protein
MGLDYVELIMATEEEFQITFADQEAGKIMTVGDLYSQVLSKLAELRTVGCLTSHTFINGVVASSKSVLNDINFFLNNRWKLFFLNGIVVPNGKS